MEFKVQTVMDYQGQIRDIKRVVGDLSNRKVLINLLSVKIIAMEPPNAAGMMRQILDALDVAGFRCNQITDLAVSEVSMVVPYEQVIIYIEAMEV